MNLYGRPSVGAPPCRAHERLGIKGRHGGTPVQVCRMLLHTSIPDFRALRGDSSYNCARSLLAFSGCEAVLTFRKTPRWLLHNEQHS
jgi:hypothetical protein